MRGLPAAVLDLALGLAHDPHPHGHGSGLVLSARWKTGHFVGHLPGIISVSAETASCWKTWPEAGA